MRGIVRASRCRACPPHHPPGVTAPVAMDDYTGPKRRSTPSAMSFSATSASASCPPRNSAHCRAAPATRSCRERHRSAQAAARRARCGANVHRFALQVLSHSGRVGLRASSLLPELPSGVAQALRHGRAVRGGSGRRPLPSLVAPKPEPEHCPLCALGYVRMALVHHHVGMVMVITADGTMHCTVCHGRGLDLERIEIGH